MRDWEEILKDIRNHKWDGEREKCLNLVNEFAAAYDIKFKEKPPSDKEKARLIGMTHRLYEDAIIFAAHPDVKQL